VQADGEAGGGEGQRGVADAAGDEGSPYGQGADARSLPLEVESGLEEAPDRVGGEPAGENGQERSAQRLPPDGAQGAMGIRRTAPHPGGGARGQQADEDVHQPARGEAEAGYALDPRAMGGGGTRRHT
jgi:hypothetical protein